jgi:hypothetical protein
MRCFLEVHDNTSYNNASPQGNEQYVLSRLTCGFFDRFHLYLGLGFK